MSNNANPPTDKATKEPTGFTCDCGEVVRYSAYVYAHWSEPLIYTCDCKRRYEIRRGKATKLKEVDA